MDSFPCRAWSGVSAPPGIRTQNHSLRESQFAVSLEAHGARSPCGCRGPRGTRAKVGRRTHQGLPVISRRESNHLDRRPYVRREGIEPPKL